MIPLVNPFFAPFPLAALVAVAPRGAAAGRSPPHKAQGAAKSRPWALWQAVEKVACATFSRCS